MKFLKSKVLATGVVVAASLVPVAAASATTTARQVYEADGVTVAPVGTTFVASGTNVKLSNSLLTNTCTMTVDGTITDNGSSSGTPTASITGATFSSCDFATTAENLPWTLQMPETGNPGTISGAEVSISALGATCVYEESGTNQVVGTWTNGSPSSVALSGSMARVSGSALLCGSSGTISGTVAISSTSTPGNNLEILPAP